MRILISILLAFFLSGTIYSQKKIDEFKVKPLTIINDAENNSGASFFRDNQVIYSHPKETRTKYDSDFLSVTISEDGTVLSEGELLDESFNSYINEVNLVFTSDYKKVYFTRAFIFDEREDLNTYKKHFDIYVADVKKDNSITNIKSLPINYNTKYSTAYPSLSPDNKTLYFASDRLESMGGFDIFKVSISENGKKFGKVINLGPNVNSKGDEITPYVLGDKLYFSSNGRGGVGEHDVFEIKTNLIKEARNLGETLNSDENDFGFIRKPNANYGFFTSNRVGSKGLNDIYYYKAFEVDAPPEIIEEEIEEFNSVDYSTETIDTVAKKTKLTTNQNPKKVIKGDTVAKLEKVTNKNVDFDASEFTEELIYGEKTELADNIYTFQRRKVYNTTKIVVGRKLVRKLNIQEKNCVNRIEKLNNIFFDSNKSIIRPEAKVEINKAIRIMSKCPNLRFVASSYTDSRGSSEYNRSLSQRRATAVVNYILKNSNLSSDIIGIGYGESGLKNNCRDGVKCSDKEHQLNRRTEIEISVIEKAKAE